MLFFKSRRHTGAVLCILITAAAMLLSSCGGGSQTPGKREALSNLSSMQIATGAGQGALYEITQPAGAKEAATSAASACTTRLTFFFLTQTGTPAIP